MKPGSGPDDGRLRIAFVVDMYDGSRTGGVRAANRFVEGLAVRNKVRLVTTGQAPDGRVVMPGFYLPCFRRIMQKMEFTFAWPRRRPLEELFRAVDVVHIQLPFLLGMSAVRIANRLGVPVVGAYHVQPENVLYNLRIQSAWLAARLNRFFVHRFYNRCDVVVCPSLFAEGELRRFGLRRPSYVISNGLDPHFRPLDGAARRGERDVFTVLMVGRLAREKRHDVVIRAVALSRHSRRIRLIFTGTGPLKDAIVRMGGGLPNPPELRLVSDEELVRLYNAADLFVHASEVELEGMSVLEAMGCGLPVLISDARTSAAKQFALDERFLFANGDPQSLAERLDYWIEHPQELQAAGPHYLQAARQNTVEDSVRRLETLYRDCANRRRSADHPAPAG